MCSADVDRYIQATGTACRGLRAAQLCVVPKDERSGPGAKFSKSRSRRSGRPAPITLPRPGPRDSAERGTCSGPSNGGHSSAPARAAMPQPSLPRSPSHCHSCIPPLLFPRRAPDCLSFSCYCASPGPPLRPTGDGKPHRFQLFALPPTLHPPSWSPSIALIHPYFSPARAVPEGSSNKSCLLGVSEHGS